MCGCVCGKQINPSVCQYARDVRRYVNLRVFQPRPPVPAPPRRASTSSPSEGGRYASRPLSGRPPRTTAPPRAGPMRGAEGLGGDWRGPTRPSRFLLMRGAGQVIKGDDLGLQGMRVGGRRRWLLRCCPASHPRRTSDQAAAAAPSGGSSTRRGQGGDARSAPSRAFRKGGSRGPAPGRPAAVTQSPRHARVGRGAMAAAALTRHP